MVTNRIVDCGTEVTVTGYISIPVWCQLTPIDSSVSANGRSLQVPIYITEGLGPAFYTKYRIKGRRGGVPETPKHPP